MKAPDKIYVARYNGEAFSHSWTMEPLGDTTATEYIRKEAVLEWVKLAYGKVSMNPFDCSEAFEELINKIDAL